MSKLLIFCGVVLTTLLTGCLSVSGGYTPEVALSHAVHRYDVTYSVSCVADGANIIGRADHNQSVKFIEEALRKSNAFSSIRYCEFEQKSNYHIHFVSHYSTLDMAEAEEREALMGLCCLAIPIGLDSFLDTTAVVYIDGNPTYSTATAESLESCYWLPFIVVNLFWNDFLAWTSIEKRSFRYLTSGIVNYQNTL